MHRKVRQQERVLPPLIVQDLKRSVKCLKVNRVLGSDFFHPRVLVDFLMEVGDENAKFLLKVVYARVWPVQAQVKVFP